MKKTASKLFYEMEEKGNKEMLKGLDNIYFDNIINPYKNSEKIIDLHTHTSYSGGSLQPDELINLAIEKRIGTLAITDINTIEGIKSINNNELIKDSQLEIINGIELQTTFNNRKTNILGYGINLDNKLLNEKMTYLKNNRLYLVLATLEQMKKNYGISFNYEDIKEIINTNNLNYLSLAKLCVKYKYATTIKEAYNKYLNETYNKIKGLNKDLSYQECIDLITNCSGIPVLANPKTLNLSEKDFLILLKEMINYKLKGIEVYHSNYNEDEKNYYLDIANKFELLISGGSDYYGEINPDIELGTGKNNNLKIKKLSILDKLH